MTEERTTEVRSPDGDTHTTHTTVVSDEPRRGGSGWAIAIVLLLAVIVGIWAFSTWGGSEMAENQAVTEAAGEVGEAAQQVGDAAQDAADSVAN
jgi:flagellar basal body-associated protein FliL